MLIRAHHIFCIQGFIGKGYSEQFIENMENIIEKLDNSDPLIEITNAPDCICTACPRLKVSDSQSGNDKISLLGCEVESEVKILDRKVADSLGIGFGKHYPYSELLKKLKYIDEEKFDYICSGCQWYSLGYCKKRIIGI
ncbi:DUF1284 domain-containing protein [Methanohalophilus sp. RSK]|uniref:DUF1284 domain-containing protein n=1 Tax=Methanohalophilus sp. RSK TaxID=2485783 RepID=UPI000F43CAAD|nr:DUF1284 domain-containing protein [Methanohalophilus sp. RSK]RNI13003.1 DUF1284 domain-containing protein [Methanohalophilus sp. RSK]